MMQQPTSLSTGKSGLIGCKPTDDIVLIDIVASLSSPPFFPRKKTADPITTPHVLNEPRSKVPFDNGLIERHEQKKPWILKAISVLKTDLKQYLPLKEAEENPIDQLNNDEPDLLVFQENLGAAMNLSHSIGSKVDLTSASLYEISLIDIYGIIHANSIPYWLTVKVCIDETYEYMIPPRSSFLLGPFTSLIPTFNEISWSSDTPGFDFILLDPPWPNRSAHRNKNKSSYKTSTFDPYDLFKLDVSKHLRQDAMVGIWITNSTKWRNFVLEKLFKAWKLEMVAEWTWLKITISGEPIFDIESVSRKPYESLILARRRMRVDQSHSSHPTSDKIILGVPDIHSRKPCVKALIEPCLSTADPRCCEIFARHLTEGWLSWGNEVIKGNWRGFWE